MGLPKFISKVSMNPSNCTVKLTLIYIIDVILWLKFWRQNYEILLLLEKSPVFIQWSRQVFPFPRTIKTLLNPLPLLLNLLIMSFGYHPLCQPTPAALYFGKWITWMNPLTTFLMAYVEPLLVLRFAFMQERHSWYSRSLGAL